MADPTGLIAPALADHAARGEIVHAHRAPARRQPAGSSMIATARVHPADPPWTETGKHAI